MAKLVERTDDCECGVAFPEVLKEGTVGHVCRCGRAWLGRAGRAWYPTTKSAAYEMPAVEGT